jgi:hypothetical protein
MGYKASRALARPRRELSACAVHALLGTGRALRDVANCLFHILPCKCILWRSLSFDAFVLLLVLTSHVSLPQVQCARLLLPNCMSVAASRSVAETGRCKRYAPACNASNGKFKRRLTRLDMKSRHLPRDGHLPRAMCFSVRPVLDSKGSFPEGVTPAPMASRPALGRREQERRVQAWRQRVERRKGAAGERHLPQRVLPLAARDAHGADVLLLDLGDAENTRTLAWASVRECHLRARPGGWPIHNSEHASRCRLPREVRRTGDPVLCRSKRLGRRTAASRQERPSAPSRRGPRTRCPSLPRDP